MSAESKMLQDAMNRLLTGQCTPEALRGSEGRWMGSLWAALADMGVPWLGIAEEYGGSGGSVADAALAVHVAARHAVPLPLPETALVAGRVLASAGIPVPDGAALACLSDVLRAEPDGDGLLVSGTAADVAWASDCEYSVGICELNGSNHVVLLRNSDAEIEPGENIAGEQRSRLTLDRVRSAAAAPTSYSSDLLRARGAAARTLAICGAADRVLELSVEHARTRQQFGKPIGMFQAVGHLLARIAGAAVAAQGAARLALRALQDDDIAAAGSAKMVASEAAGTVAELAHQLHGAIGLTREHQLQLFTRRLWAWRSEYGSDRYWARRCGEQLLVSTATDPWRDLVVA